MALVSINGFEDAAELSGGTGNPINAAGRNGNCLGLGSGLSGAGTWKLPAFTPNATVTFGFAFRQDVMPGAMSSNNWVLLVYASDGLTDQVRICMGANGQVALYRAGTQIIGAISATGVVPVAQWCYVECQLFCHDTAGTAVVRVNGTTVISVSAVDTKNSASLANYGFLGFTANAGATPTNTRWDDLYLMAGAGDSFLGDAKVETLYPNGNGAASQWVGSDADSVNNYLLVNETGAPVTTTYTASSVTGNQDLYTLDDLVSTAGTVLGVCHAAHAAKSDAGVQDLKVVNRGSAATRSAAVGLTTTYTTFYYPLSTNPDTGSAWTIADVNALQGGVETV
jgi:hypothetical protein